MFVLFCRVYGTSTAKQAMSKSELLTLAKEQEITDPSTAENMTKEQLLSLLGSSGTGPAVQQVKLKSYKLQPQGVCWHDGKVFLFDGATAGVWSVVVSLRANKHHGNATLLGNVPQLANVSKIQVTDSSVLIASRSSGLISLKVADWSGTKFLTQSPVEGLTVSQSQQVIYYSCQNQVFMVTEDGAVSLCSGAAQTSRSLTSKDGLSQTATHAQCGPLLMSGKSVIVGDKASLNLRIITDVGSCLDYLKITDLLYEAFCVHSHDTGYRMQLSSEDILENLNKICLELDSMVTEVREFFDNATLKPNGPQGSVPYVTISMFHDLKAGMHSLYKSVQEYKSDYPINVASLLSVPCEHHFATMRSRYQMPTLLQYCHLQNDVVAESLKRMTTTAYKYFTGKDSYYPKPELQAVDLHINYRAVEVTNTDLSAADKKLMQNWRKDFCAGRDYHVLHLIQQ